MQYQRFIVQWVSLLLASLLIQGHTIAQETEFRGTDSVLALSEYDIEYLPGAFRVIMAGIGDGAVPKVALG